jgi:hypothetical protein
VSTNGRNTWTVEPSPTFIAHLASAEANYPRLREVLDSVRFELSRDPFDEWRTWPLSEAQRKPPTDWLIESGGTEAGAPVVWVYFRVWQGRKVTMIDFAIAEEWEDRVFGAGD